jgi:hypothetical protein
MDIMPGEPALQSETVHEAGEADPPIMDESGVRENSMEQGGMEESGVAPDSQSPPVIQDRESSTRRPIENHAVIVTDWMHDAETRATLEIRSPR